MKTDRERRPIYVKRRGGGLFAVAPEDHEALTHYPGDAELEVTIKQRRSLPRLRLYWSALHRVLEATGSFPNAERLHDAIKAKLGYVTRLRMLDGTEALVVDSVALSRMDEKEFGEFFDAAMKLLAETFGFDPLEEAA